MQRERVYTEDDIVYVGVGEKERQERERKNANHPSKLALQAEFDQLSLIESQLKVLHNASVDTYDDTFNGNRYSTSSSTVIFLSIGTSTLTKYIPLHTQLSSYAAQQRNRAVCDRSAVRGSFARAERGDGEE